MRRREKMVSFLKGVIITKEDYKSEKSKYKLLGYDERIDRIVTLKRLIEIYSIREEIIMELIKTLYYDKKFIRELEENMLIVRKEAEEYYYKEMKKELNIH